MLWLLSNVVQVRTQELDSLNIVLPIQLFVNAMSCIRTASHWQQKHILSGGLLKRQCHWNTSSLSCKIGFDTPNMFDSLCGRSEVPVLRRCNPPFSSVL